MRLWAWPLLLAALSLAGLIAGLLGADAFDFACWAGLVAPVLAAGWAWSRRRRTASP